MAAKDFFIGLVALLAVSSRTQAADHDMNLKARQATTTSPATLPDECSIPSSLVGAHAYSNQPTYNAALSAWGRVLHCDSMECCIPSSLSSDWASYTSAMQSWWSTQSSAVISETMAIYSFYSSAAANPACSGSVHTVASPTVAEYYSDFGKCTAPGGSMSYYPIFSELTQTTSGTSATATITSASSTDTSGSVGVHSGIFRGPGSSSSTASNSTASSSAKAVQSSSSAGGIHRSRPVLSDGIAVCGVVMSSAILALAVIL